MNQYVLINRIQVQNANAVSGFTWGFPAVTHFLGFVHNLTRKLMNSDFSKMKLSGCAVIAHEHHVHTYGKYGDNFTQSRNPPYLPSHDKASAPPVIEEGKMNMTVSLLIGCEGNVGYQANDFIGWLEKHCLMQRLAGGTILDIDAVSIVSTETNADRHAIKRKLLPGFSLMDRSSSLENHFEKLKEKNSEAEMLDAWLDFSALKQQSRPRFDLIQKYLDGLSCVSDSEGEDLLTAWQSHLAVVPYDAKSIPNSLRQHFSNLQSSKSNAKLIVQWQEYIQPTENSDADWERLPKPESKGFFVPLMIGYKAITSVFENEKIANTRDSETPVCFVEAVHSVGEWRGVNRLRSAEDFAESLWHYSYEEHWYLCQQRSSTDKSEDNNEATLVATLDEIFGE
ncbi:hypothetical protein NBRC116188_21400 [Oceaniserpentilla sp. 4NH20-0058]|uniref:type I-F CRISPR-associated protein Csy2 n=1 Tax=Oceaniserpentilla sp. 4NH20-0058 TaxID=3127660 RepID=UPI0031091A34